MTAEERVVSTRFVLVNTHHARRASAVLARMFSRTNLGIALIQEPWVYRVQVMGLSSSNSKVIWKTMGWVGGGGVNSRACVTVRNEFILSAF